ncbi:MAG: hypothetical protein IPO18_05855 [bacterium]|nr:hypothetical protein [bacterium]
MNMFANASRLTCAALALALLAGPAAAAEIGEPVLGLQDQPVISLGGDLGASSALVTNVVYDSTNQTVSAASSTTDLNAIYGDQLMVAGGIGEDVSAMKFAVFCSGSSTGALVSATETLRFYDLDNAGAYVGGFSVGLGALAQGFYSIYTTTDIENVVLITLPSMNLLVTQQLSSVVGASRMGTVLSYANAPAVGATNNAFYASNAAQAAGWYLITGQTYSNPHYKLETVQSTVPTESQSWGSLKAEYR